MGQNNKYVPIDLDALVDQIQCPRHYTIDNYVRELASIEATLKYLGGPLETGGLFHFADILYPKYALSILALSRTEEYAFHPNNVLEAMFKEWLRNNATNTADYIKKLLAAIVHTNSMDYLLARLNIDCITPPLTTDSIRISTKRGTRTIHAATTPAHDVLKGNARVKAQTFLKKHKRFVGKLSVAEANLRSHNNNSNLEQIILSWVGYMLMKTILINSADMKIQGGELLMLTEAGT